MIHVTYKHPMNPKNLKQYKTIKVACDRRLPCDVILFKGDLF